MDTVGIVQEGDIDQENVNPRPFVTVEDDITNQYVTKKTMKRRWKRTRSVSGLCVQTKQSEELTEQPEELTEQPTEKEEVKEVAVGGLHVSTGGGTALQTLQALVTASGGRQSVKCHLLLDSACNKTFISSELVQMFKAKPK